MQGRKGVFDSFPETVDLNQGTVSNNSVSHNVRSFSGWDLGESSSGANIQNQGGGDDGLKMEHARSSSFNAYGGVETRLEERRFEPSNILMRESSGVSGLGGPLTMQGSSSNPINLNVNLNTGYAGDVDGGGLSMGPSSTYPDFYKFGGSETEHNSTTENIGTSSGDSGYFVENDGGSGSSSLVSWGSSCKRKALEGTSGQSHTGNTIPPRYNASSTLNIYSPAMNSPNDSPPELLNPRIGGVASDVFPPPSVAESSARNFGPRVNLGHQESQFNLPSTGQPGRHSNVSSRPLSFSNYLDSRSTPSATTNSNILPNAHSMHIPIMSRNMIPFPWNGTLNPRSGSSSSSVMLSGERNTQRNNIEHPMFAPPPEMRNLVQDPTNWGLATGNSSTANGGGPSSSRIGPSSGVRPFPTTWIPHHSPPTQSHQRLTEFSPWSLFPPVDSESGGQRSHFTPLPSGPSSSSSEESMMSSGANSHGHHSLFSRSALLMEVPPADDVNGWHVLAAGIEGRQRLVSEIRQVLNAMRRGEVLRAEDHMLIDPFINGVAELHDRHRDMRLDVDNMSYEELLALEERIGNVSTGLSEETIMESMQQQKHFSITEGSPSTLEPCCICQENYCTGDDIGTLDCGHDFHTNCIKQWLTQKNLCPICKTAALNTGEGG